MRCQSIRAPAPATNASRQRGAFSVLAASALVASLTMVAFAVDSGRLFYQQGQVQGAADAAAVAATSEYAEGDDAGDPAAALAAAEAVAESSLGSLEDVSLTFGRVESEDGRLAFHPDDGGMAIKASVARETPMSLVAGWIWPDDALIRANAVGEQPRVVELQAGSAVAHLDSDESPVLDALFGGLLDAGGDVSVVSYQGLADTSISLMELAEVQSGVGTVEELLELTLSLGEFIELLARVAPGGSTAEIDLNDLSSRVSPQLEVALGDVIDLEFGGDSAAAATEIDAFSLLQLSAMSANQDSAIELDLSSVDGLLSTLGLEYLELALTIIEPPQIAIGRVGSDPTGEWRTEVETGQLDLELELAMADLLSDLVAVEALVGVEAGGSTARALDIAQSSEGPEVTVEGDSGVADLIVDALVSEDLLLGADLARIEAYPSLSNAGEELVFTQPFGAEHSQSMGVPVSAAFANLEEDDFTVTLLNWSSSLASELITEELSPMLSDLAGEVVDPLLTGLGLRTGIAEISVNEVRAGSPRLVQ